MPDSSEALLNAVNEIRDLIRLMAEPAIAERDKKMRFTLRQIAGKSLPKAKAILLMDGTRTQVGIHRESGLDKGHLSVLVKQLGLAGLLSGDAKEPTLAIQVPGNFFESGVSSE